VLNPFTRPTTKRVCQNCCKYRYIKSSCITENPNLCNSTPSLNARQRSGRENNGSRIGYGNFSLYTKTCTVRFIWMADSINKMRSSKYIVNLPTIWCTRKNMWSCGIQILFLLVVHLILRFPKSICHPSGSSFSHRLAPKISLFGQLPFTNFMHILSHPHFLSSETISFTQHLSMSRRKSYQTKIGV
jgi:hypothetical protein